MSTTTKPTVSDIKYGDLSVPFKVTNKKGLPEAMTFEELSNEDLHKFAALFSKGDSFEMVKLCSRRDSAWVNSLTRESYFQLIAHFTWANFTMAMEMSDYELITGFNMKQVREEMAKLREKLAPQSDQPKSSESTSPSDSSNGTAKTASPALTDSAAAISV